jgi:UDP-N-acetylglucosamine 2-epimerase (non-hydrolysing)
MPDAVIVHGDTTTAYVAALCAFYLSIPVFHVEAGLRSGSIRAPFPEEFNRRAISLVSDLHFAPTKEAEENLLREGVDEKNIVVTGNTAIDSLRYTLREDYSHPYLAWARKKKLILLTCHRRESFGAPMREIFCAVRRVCRQRKDVCVLFPAHPSPTVRKIAREIFSDCASVRLVEPLGAVDFHNILSRCYAAATDSGGIQEEASALHIPTLVLRERTERAEGVRSGGLLLGGIREEEVFDALTRLLDSRELYQKMSRAPCPFGDGYSSRRIADEITKRLH